jgi:hypothetical protein
MADIHIRLDTRISMASLRWGLGLALLACASPLGSETLTLTTTYPAPSGIYNRIITTGLGGASTVLNRDLGNTGIGTAAPGYKLEVAGTVGLKADGAHTGALKVAYVATAPAGYYAVYAP